MIWGTIFLTAGKWCRTNWRVCVLLAFLASVVAAQLYLRHKWREEGRSEERAKHGALLVKAQAEMIQRDLRNAAEQAKAFANGQAIGESRVRDQQEIIANRDRLIADQRAGIVRLRQQWRGCVSQAEGGGTAPLPGGLMPDDGLRATGAADLVRIGQDADSRVARLVEFVHVQKTLCEAIQ